MSATSGPPVIHVNSPEGERCVLGASAQKPRRTPPPIPLTERCKALVPVWDFERCARRAVSSGLCRPHLAQKGEGTLVMKRPRPEA